MPYMSLFLLSADAPFWNVLLIALFLECIAKFSTLLNCGHFPALSLLYCLQHALSEPFLLFADAPSCWIVSTSGSSHHWNLVKSYF